VSQDRIEDIDYWWSGGFPGSFDFADGSEERIYKAFRRVLLALSAEHFERFMGLDPTIICIPSTRGKVFRLRQVAPASQKPVEMFVNVIYLAPGVGRWTDATLAGTVAHEVGHLILGHHELGAHTPQEQGWSASRESAADDLAESWGFGRRYSKARLDALRKLGTPAPSACR